MQVVHVFAKTLAMKRVFSIGEQLAILFKSTAEVRLQVQRASTLLAFQIPSEEGEVDDGSLAS